MKTYKTEFPVRNDITASEFLACALHWINGIQDSTLDFQHVDSEDDDSVYALSNDMNEEFKCIRVPHNTHPQFGFSYRTRKENGLVFETECIFRTIGDVGIVSVHASCVTTNPATFAQTPLKPAIIKLALERDWSNTDDPRHAQKHGIEITTIEQLNALVTSGAPSQMPFAILLSNESGRFVCSPYKAANDLCGLAQVYLIRDGSLRSKLFESIEASDETRCLFRISANEPIESIRGEQSLVLDNLKRLLVGYYANNESKRGAEWTDLLEAQLTLIRKRSSRDESTSLENKLNDEISLNEQIIKEKQRKIDDLQDRIETLSRAQLGSISIKSEHELFEGEFLDRIVVFLQRHLGELDKDRRLRTAIECFIAASPPSRRKKDFIRKLKSCRDSNSLVQFLQDIGFAHSQDGKHHKLAPKPEQTGFGQVTIAKTPSDHRAIDNTISDIKRALALDY